MKGLSKTWITDPWIDAEYKSYVLLAYLHEVGLNFEQQKLYPHLSELIDYYRDATSLKEVTDAQKEGFSKELIGFDLENFRLNYESLINTDPLLDEVICTLDFSIPQMKTYLEKGKQIYEEVEKHTHIEPVGVVPIYLKEGYLLLENRKKAATDVYEYQVTFFESSQDQYRSLRTHYLLSYPVSLTHTYPWIKSQLVRMKQDIPHPAAYAVESEINVPIEECLLPIAKRMLMRQLKEG